MNDRFKFRVWDIEEWTYLKCKYSKSAGYHKYTFGKHNVWQDIGYFIESNPKYYIVEQCTGLKDKNGNLIYESDYVKDKDGDIYLVKWDAELVQFNATGKDNCGFETITPFMKGETETLEICGNIHEQAEQKEQQ